VNQDRITVQSPGLPPVAGTLRGGVLRLVLKDGDNAFDATATLKAAELAVGGDNFGDLVRCFEVLGVLGDADS